MTLIDDHKAKMLDELPAFLHGDPREANAALHAMLERSAVPATFAWTMSHLSSIAGNDLRLIHAPILATVDRGDAFFGFQAIGEADAADAAAMQIVIANANSQVEDAATLIRALIEQPEDSWAARVVISTARITRNVHAQACGGHR